MTSSNGNIFRVTGHLCGEIHRSPVNSPHKGQWRGALMFSLICVWITNWVINREAGDLRRYCAHYDVIVMAYGARPLHTPKMTPFPVHRPVNDRSSIIINNNHHILRNSYFCVLKLTVNNSCVWVYTANTCLYVWQEEIDALKRKWHFDDFFVTGFGGGDQFLSYWHFCHWLQGSSENDNMSFTWQYGLSMHASHTTQLITVLCNTCISYWGG